MVAVGYYNYAHVILLVNVGQWCTMIMRMFNKKVFPVFRTAAWCCRFTQCHLFLHITAWLGLQQSNVDCRPSADFADLITDSDTGNICWLKASFFSPIPRIDQRTVCSTDVTKCSTLLTSFCGLDPVRSTALLSFLTVYFSRHFIMKYIRGEGGKGGCCVERVKVYLSMVFLVFLSASGSQSHTQIII